MSTSSVPSKKPHLVLHFDVNKTILLCDPVSGMDVLGMLQSSVSECSWGVVDEDGHWQLTHDEPLFTAPSEHHTTYSDFLEYGEFKLLPNPENDPAIAARNKKCKSDKKQHKKIFTDPGQPGEKMRPLFEKMVEKLRIPESLKAQCAAHELDHLHGDFAFILPSFFRFVSSFFRLRATVALANACPWHTLTIFLCAIRSIDALQREGRTFSVVFRTFGTETQEIADSFNAFRKGEHPFVPSPSASSPVFHRGTIQFPEQLGCFKRGVDGEGKETIHLHLGTIDPKQTKPYRTIEGFSAIHSFLEAESKKGVSYSLRDDYPFWASKAEASDAGKPHAVNPSDSTCHHIFFDDNIERTHAHIVDCRDISQNDATIPFQVAWNRWMVKSEPVSALMDDLYFRKAIALCEANLKSFQVQAGKPSNKSSTTTK